MSNVIFKWYVRWSRTYADTLFHDDLDIGPFQEQEQAEQALISLCKNPALVKATIYCIATKNE